MGGSLYVFSHLEQEKKSAQRGKIPKLFTSVIVTYTEILDQSVTRTAMGLIKWSKKEKPSRETMNTIGNKQSDTGKRLMYTVLSVAEKQVARERWSLFLVGT